MKPFLSVDGSVEAGLGLGMVIFGAFHMLIPGRDDPWLSAVMLVAGTILLGYGLVLRREQERRLEKKG